MSRILSEKGAAVIQAVEAGARTGMMGMMWGGQQVQTLIDETAQLSDILYITVADKEGLILASSNHDLIGTRMDTGLPKIQPDSPEAVNWRLKRIDNRQEVFEVSRYFRPITDQTDWMRRRMDRMMPGHGMGMDNDWCFPGTNPGKDAVMMVGLDICDSKWLAGLLRRKPVEQHLVNLLEDIKDIVSPISQTDPSFRTTKLYSPITAAEVYRRLKKDKGYSDQELPTIRTINNKLNQLGYRLKKVGKSKPKKKFQKLMPSSIMSILQTN